MLYELWYNDLEKGINKINIQPKGKMYGHKIILQGTPKKFFELYKHLSKKLWIFCPFTALRIYEKVDLRPHLWFWYCITDMYGGKRRKVDGQWRICISTLTFNYLIISKFLRENFSYEIYDIFDVSCNERRIQINSYLEDKMVLKWNIIVT